MPAHISRSTLKKRYTMWPRLPVRPRGRTKRRGQRAPEGFAVPAELDAVAHAAPPRCRDASCSVFYLGRISVIMLGVLTYCRPDVSCRNEKAIGRTAGRPDMSERGEGHQPWGGSAVRQRDGNRTTTGGQQRTSDAGSCEESGAVRPMTRDVGRPGSRPRAPSTLPAYPVFGSAGAVPRARHACCRRRPCPERFTPGLRPRCRRCDMKMTGARGAAWRMAIWRVVFPGACFTPRNMIERFP